MCSANVHYGTNALLVFWQHKFFRLYFCRWWWWVSTELALSFLCNCTPSVSMCVQTLQFGILCVADFLVWFILSELLKDFSQLAKQEFNIKLAEGIVPDFSFLFGGWVVVGGIQTAGQMQPSSWQGFQQWAALQSQQYWGMHCLLNQVPCGLSLHLFLFCLLRWCCSNV